MIPRRTMRGAPLTRWSRLRSRAVTMLAMGILLPVFVACGSSGGTVSSSGGNEDTASASSGDALVIDGEQIASAKLMNAARKDGTLTSYFLYPPKQWNKVLDQFTSDTGIEIDRVRLTTAKLYPKVVSEAAAGKLGADIIDIGDPILVQNLIKKKIVQKFTPPNANEIPTDLRADKHYYEITELPPQVIAYNTAKVDADDAPKSFKDLLDPKWKGKIGMTPIVTGGSSFSIAYIQRSKLGVDYWKKLAAQDPKFYQSVAVVTPDVARGQIPVAITDLGVITSLKKQGAPIKAVFPSEGTPVFAAFSLISATTKKKDAALVYEAWVASKRGSSVIAKYMTGYPSNPDAELPDALPASVRPNLVRPPLKVWQTKLDAWTKQWKSIFSYS